MLVWIDLETTGLDASKDKVLEVAAVITDDALNEVARFHRVTSEARRVDFTQVDPYVLEMHSKNDLWTESLQAKDEYVYDESTKADREADAQCHARRFKTFTSKFKCKSLLEREWFETHSAA